MWTGRGPVLSLEVPCPNHLSCKPGLRARYVNTSPEKFFEPTNFLPVQPIYTERVRTNFGRCQYIIYLLYFLSKALTRHQAFTAQTVCKNLRGSGVYKSPRKRPKACTPCCSKTCTVPRVPYKLKAAPYRFFFCSKIGRSHVNGYL